MLLHHIRALFRGTHGSMLRDLKDVQKRLAEHSNYKTLLVDAADTKIEQLRDKSARHEAHADELFDQSLKLRAVINATS